MKKFVSLPAAICTAVLFAPCGVFAAKGTASKTTAAQTKAIAKYDTNKNGKLDPDEYEGVRKDFAAAPNGILAKLDLDKDGKLSDEEVAKLGAPERKKGEKSDAARAEKRAQRAAKKKA